MKIFEHLFHRKKIQQRNFIIFSAVIIGMGLLVIIYNVLFQCATCYMTYYLVGGVAGLIVETLGTKLNLWQYYNKERPPAISFFTWGSVVVITVWFVNYFRLV